MVSSGAAVNAYTGWGMYGAAKAAMNHLALTLSTEEPDVTTMAIRPGVVDTEMQREIREVPDISGMVLEHHIKDSSVPGPTAAVHHGRRLSLGVLQIRQVVDIGLLS